MKLATVLENGTDSPFEVRSESSSGVHALLTTLGPKETYKLVRSSSDTYLQHWVVMGDAPVVSFSSDELIDNQRITIVCAGAATYKKVVVPRHTPKSISMYVGLLLLNLCWYWFFCNIILPEYLCVGGHTREGPSSLCSLWK
jgi:hypothetical protein